MSIEAFAMAGVDYMECTKNVCALEQRFRMLEPAEAKVESDPRLRHVSTGLGLDNGMAKEWVKVKMRQWATAVASNNETKANLRVSEILLIMDNNHLM